jgi:excinuclease ABC subunit A
MVQLQKLVDAGNTVIAVEHDMRVISESDWVLDMGPGAGEDGGKIVAEGRPSEVARLPVSLTGKYLARFLARVHA